MLRELQEIYQLLLNNVMHTTTKHFCHVFSNQTDAKSNTNRVSSGTKATEHTWTKTVCYQTQIGTIRSKICFM